MFPGRGSGNSGETARASVELTIARHTGVLPRPNQQGVVANECAENRSNLNSARVGCQSHEQLKLGNGPVGIHLGNARQLIRDE